MLLAEIPLDLPAVAARANAQPADLDPGFAQGHVIGCRALDRQFPLGRKQRAQAESREADSGSAPANFRRRVVRA